jgi:hypothetical protein
MAATTRDLLKHGPQRLCTYVIVDDYVKQAIATKIIELAKAGERNPDILCEKALEEICKPACCSQVSAGSAGGDAVNDALT